MSIEDAARLSPQRFQNRPVNVEAMFYDDTDSGQAIQRWAREYGTRIDLIPATEDKLETLVIRAEDGIQVCRFGAWVVKGGIVGDPHRFYVTARDTFAAVYRSQDEIQQAERDQIRALIALGGLPSDF